MTKTLIAVGLSYSMLIMNALYTMPPTIERTESNCEGYAWLHINCDRPFAAEIKQRKFPEGTNEEQAAYDLAKTAHCVMPSKKTIMFRLKHSGGNTYDWCILFKEN